MIVIKTPAELARTVRRVAREMRSHQCEAISDLNQAAGILERLADAQTATELSNNILEEPL
jgi:hypothetical protein